LEAGRWIYHPPADFVGTIQLRISVSDGLSTDVNVIEIDVGDEQ
jgi:hypothetical protein